MPSFLLTFGIACLAVAMLAISISKIPFGIGKAFGEVISVSCWILMAKMIWFLLSWILHSPFASNP